MQTYWLYHRNTPITSVRLPEGATASEVREKALRDCRTVPLCYPELPGSFQVKIYHSEVKVFDDQGAMLDEAMSGPGR